MKLTYLAKKNFQHQPGRSFCLVVVVMLLAFFLFSGSVLNLSLSKGLDSMSSRLGADIMIVPEGYDPHLDTILLSGKPTTFYLPSTAMQDLKALQDDLGIEAISPQTFLATLRASCCSYPVQLVGVDYDSDFVVKPWLKKSIYRDIQDGEIIIGAHISGSPGDKITFFDQELTVAGRLEQTGTGFDSIAFMNRNTIAVLSQEAERIAGRTMRNDGSLNSIIMIKLKPGYSPSVSAHEINRQLNSKGIYALISKRFVNNITSGLKIISYMIQGGIIILWLLAVIIISLVFTLSLSERKRDFGVLRAIGATRGKIILLCLYEVFMISSYGALIGIILGVVLIAAGSPFVIEAVKLPFLLPPLQVLLLLAVCAFLAAVITGIISALWSSFRAGRIDIQDIVKGA